MRIFTEWKVLFGSERCRTHICVPCVYLYRLPTNLREGNFFSRVYQSLCLFTGGGGWHLTENKLVYWTFKASSRWNTRRIIVDHSVCGSSLKSGLVFKSCEIVRFLYNQYVASSTCRQIYLEENFPVSWTGGGTVVWYEYEFLYFILPCIAKRWIYNSGSSWHIYSQQSLDQYTQQNLLRTKMLMGRRPTLSKKIKLCERCSWII